MNSEYLEGDGSVLMQV